jgi:hypothetical protein
VLPDGNFLINSGDIVPSSCLYAEYDATTGVATGSSFIVPGHSTCTGVDTDGTSLYFSTDFSTLTKTTLAGALISDQPVGPNLVEDISLVAPAVFGGTPGDPNCYGQSVAALNAQFGNQPAAAAALGYPSVNALHDAIHAFCGK